MADYPGAVEYRLGDLVVYRDFYIDFLLKIDLLIDEKTIGYRGANRHSMYFEGAADKETIRIATKAEIKAKKRLP